MLAEKYMTIDRSMPPIPTYPNSTEELVSLVLTTRQLCDLELILNGGFAP